MPRAQARSHASHSAANTLKTYDARAISATRGLAAARACRLLKAYELALAFGIATCSSEWILTRTLATHRAMHAQYNNIRRAQCKHIRLHLPTIEEYARPCPLVDAI